MPPEIRPHVNMIRAIHLRAPTRSRISPWRPLAALAMTLVTPSFRSAMVAKMLASVWPETREQRCWIHRLANVLDKLPKRLQPKAKQALQML